MMNRSLGLALVLGLIVPAGGAGAAGSAWEGVVEMKMTTKMGGGNITINIGKGGVKTNMSMNMGGDVPMTFTTLVKASNRDVVYMLDESSKTYSEIDVNEQKKRMGAAGASKFTVKRLGKVKVAGYDAVHSKVTDDRGSEFEVWTTKDLFDYEEVARAMGPRGAVDDNFMKALKAEGADGFLVKMKHEKPGKPEETVNMELVRAQKKALPASTFEIPAGFTKRTGPPMGPPAGLPPEIQKKLEEQMKNMTPEQREAVKRAMQKGQ